MTLQAAIESFAAQDFLFARMQADDLDEVMQIETVVFPVYGQWTRQSFNSAMNAKYDCWLARAHSGKLVGYFVLMSAVEEIHLLTIAVHADWQGKGVGRLLLDKVLAEATELQMKSLLLEVRPSNECAIAMYRDYGFEQIGQRKNYYAGPDQTREDALVMRMAL